MAGTRKDMERTHKDADKVLKEIEKQASFIQDLLDSRLRYLIKHDRTAAKALMEALIFMPLSFIMGTFSTVAKNGVEPNEMFPSFITVYMNYAQSLGIVQEDWTKLNFKEFNEKFMVTYKNNGHYAYEYDTDDTK